MGNGRLFPEVNRLAAGDDGYAREPASHRLFYGPSGGARPGENGHADPSGARRESESSADRLRRHHTGIAARIRLSELRAQRPPAAWPDASPGSPGARSDDAGHERGRLRHDDG